MANEKKTALSIVIRAIDRATAPIRAVGDRIAKLTSGVSDSLRRGLGGALGGVMRAVSAVGGAVAGVLGRIPLIGTVLAGTVGAAVAGVMSLVGHFDELGDKAESIGVGVDFLAQMRYAAKRSGASVEELDAGLQSFSKNMGLLRANGGGMLKFLSTVSPTLVKQLKATKGNEQAIDLLAGAFGKLTDPAKRAAAAQQIFGDASLAPLFHKGAAGVKALRDRYAELAGSQEEAAARSGEVDDAMIDLGASVDGIKAGLVRGLAPALTVVAKKLQVWLVDHREDIAKWAEEIGSKIPGAIEEVVKWIEKAIGKVQSFAKGVGWVIDKVESFVEADDRRAWVETNDRRKAFYKRSIKAGLGKEKISDDELEAQAQLAIREEDQMRARFKAQSAGIDWTKAGDEERFGQLRGRTTVYSPAELRALLPMFGPGKVSEGVSNMGLITQALAKPAAGSDAAVPRADATAAAIRALDASRALVVEAVSAAMQAKQAKQAKPQEAYIRVDVRGPSGTRATVEPRSTADIDMTLGVQTLPRW